MTRYIEPMDESNETPAPVGPTHDLLDGLFLEPGDRVETRDADGAVLRRGIYDGPEPEEGGESYSGVVWDGDRAVSCVPRVDLHKAEAAPVGGSTDDDDLPPYTLAHVARDLIAWGERWGADLGDIDSRDFDPSATSELDDLIDGAREALSPPTEVDGRVDRDARLFASGITHQQEQALREPRGERRRLLCETVDRHCYTRGRINAFGTAVLDIIDEAHRREADRG